jgi:hypothetical protein
MLPCASGRQSFESACSCVDIGGEVLKQGRLTVKGDNRNLVRDVPDDGFEHGRHGRSNGGEFIKLSGSSASNLENDDKGERLASSVLLEDEFLRNTIIRQGKVLCRERVDKLATLLSYQCRDKDESGASAEIGLLSRRRSL